MVSIEADSERVARRQGRSDWAIGAVLVALILLLGWEAVLVPPDGGTPDDRPVVAAPLR